MNPLTVNPAIVLNELHRSPSRRPGRTRQDRAASAARTARVALQRASR
ncbi:hypothetical protein [Nocardioides mangrovi]|uniref:Uncharacterized protein n=1 Tax=Nocardioides mangrovi TaxID=2874580 RepID=A0ABS7UB58_9ACTN|nr:hypothetical protein [Nocardioides mangrovi]MBZ5738120.1 hypothetical protein [Nocardioides mangrovi]